MRPRRRGPSSSSSWSGPRSGPGGSPPVGDFLFGEWLREELRRDGPPPPGPMPDLAIALTAVRAGGRPLTGPPPAELLDPVPEADLVLASVAGIPALLDDLAGDARNVLLTLVRVWVTLATGEIRSKDAAADWAIARLPAEHRPVLEHARDLYRERHYADEVWSHDLEVRVRPCAAEVCDRVDDLRRRV
ncbi:aminoglycoside adenylyltransferase domain-containing protein [Lentzea sp.]|uniref:aminoglycoside adenylyltransferase domain-containing protein n=1 Tax=Lentzea sp. TaxID=56099 RepID=UPI002ED5BC0C